MKNYKNFILENKETGIFSIKQNGITISLKLKYENTDKGLNVKIMNNDSIYEDLSIFIPDTKKLNNNQFFVNPEVENYIIEVLIKQGFINKTNIKSKAGKDEVFAYNLNFS